MLTIITPTTASSNEPAHPTTCARSLGGSLAQLAAYEAVQAVEAGSLGRPGAVSVHCYTYGAPRTGNHAFAKDYDRVVPDTWCIINGGWACVCGRRGSGAHQSAAESDAFRW